MGSRSEKDRQKALQDKCQQLLNEMLRDEDNKYCVDCDAKGPRWASWNLGIFLCIRCAGIHRNLGVHISKVKSVNLDSWTPEQVVSLQQMGNSRARAVYEANLPDNFRRPQTDSPLESFVRAKYEQKKYIAREWVPPPIPKVNWDKEIEEEEMARRRRKDGKSAPSQSSKAVATSSPGGHSLSAEIPAPLPKPKTSASPKPSRMMAISSTTSPPASSVMSSATLDLLGLDTPTGGSNSPSTGDDIFSGFLSAPPLSNSTANVSPPPTTSDSSKEDVGVVTGENKRSVEENNFFNQPASSIQEKKQLTKDSILALYSTAGTQPQSFGGAPGSVFPTPGATGFGAVPPAGMGMNFTLPTGVMMGQPLPQTSLNHQTVAAFGAVSSQPGSVNAAQTGMPNLTSNPFFNMTGSTLPSGVFPVHNQATQGLGSSSDLLDLQESFSSLSSSNTTSQLPQQMNILSISGAAVNPTVQQGVTVPNPWGSSSQPNASGGIMNMSQASFPQGQTSLGHTLASNLWQ